MAITPAKAETDKRHNAKLDQMLIKPYKAEGEQIRAAAAEAGQSLQGYILQAVRERMERDGWENMYQQYHNLGVNGVMDDVRTKYFALPIQSEDD